MSEISKGSFEQIKRKQSNEDIINNQYLKLNNYRKKYGIDEETNLLILRHNEEKQELINKYLSYKQNILTETKIGFDVIKKEVIKMPNDYIGTLEDWKKLPNELKEYIVNGGTDVLLDPIELIIGGTLGKKLFLSIKKTGEAFLQMQGKELIKVDLVKEGGNIMKILKNTGDDLVYFTKRFLENIFESDFITPEGFNFKDFDFDNGENKEENKPFKESVSFENALEEYVIPKDIENMTTQEFGRTLKHGIIRNWIDLEGKLNTMTEERRERFFDKHIEVMELIVKWCEKNPNEAEKYFKNDLKEYFFGVNRNAREYDLDDIKNTNIKNNITKLMFFIEIY